MAKDVLAEMFRSGKSIDEAVGELGGGQVSDEAEIAKIAADIINANPKQLEQYRAGKTSLIGFFVGQVMKQSAGRANPQVVNSVLNQFVDEEGGARWLRPGVRLFCSRCSRCFFRRASPTWGLETRWRFSRQTTAE